MDKRNTIYDEAFMAEYLTGEMEESRALGFDQALEKSHELKAGFESFKSDWSQINEAILVSDEEINQAWDRQKTMINSGNQRRVWFRLVAAVVLLCSLAVVIIRYSSPTVITVSSDELVDKKYRLPDGSDVYLYPGTAIQFSEGFEDNRDLLLQGEAFFDVVRDEENPFVVDLENAKVTVLGTSFNIQESDHGHSVLVKSGKVSYQQSADTPVILTANMNLKSAKGLVTVDSLKVSNVLSWYTKSLKFEQTPLSEVIRELGHTYQHGFKFDEESISGCYLTANYDGVSLSDIKYALSKMYGLKMLDQESQTIIQGASCDMN